MRVTFDRGVPGYEAVLEKQRVWGKRNIETPVKGYSLDGDFFE